MYCLKNIRRIASCRGNSVFKIAGGEGGQAILNELKIANFPKILMSSLDRIDIFAFTIP